MEKWQEALALISLRETELQESFEKVSKIKTNVFNLEIELKEQNNFLDNEKDNVRELQHHIDVEENNYRYDHFSVIKVPFSRKGFAILVSLANMGLNFLKNYDICTSHS